ncbi:hypothetical protein Tco_1515253 [Tanacetum coccineum]
MKLIELMNLCTQLQSRVLALENIKSNQALEIESLKRRVKSLEKRRKSRTLGFKRLRKVGSTSREKDVAKKEVSDADTVTTAGEVVTTVNVEVTIVNPPTTTIDELTLAHTLIEIKAAKPKVVTFAATKITTTRPKARGVVVQEPSEFKTTSSSLQASQLPQAKDKEEQEQLSIEEKSKLFVELLEKRKKHFASLRDKEKRNKPPTKAQKRNTMSTYLKNMAGYKHNQLKSKSYNEIQEMFDKEMKRVNTFVDINSELVEGSKTKAEGSSKRVGDELEHEKATKQKGDKS